MSLLVAGVYAIGSYSKASEHAFRIGIKKKLDAMVKDENVLRATAELLLAEAE